MAKRKDIQWARATQGSGPKGKADDPEPPVPFARSVKQIAAAAAEQAHAMSEPSAPGTTPDPEPPDHTPEAPTTEDAPEPVMAEVTADAEGDDDGDMDAPDPDDDPPEPPDPQDPEPEDEAEPEPAPADDTTDDEPDEPAVIDAGEGFGRYTAEEAQALRDAERARSEARRARRAEFRQQDAPEQDHTPTADEDVLTAVRGGVDVEVAERIATFAGDDVSQRRRMLEQAHASDETPDQMLAELDAMAREAGGDGGGGAEEVDDPEPQGEGQNAEALKTALLDDGFVDELADKIANRLVVQ